MHELKVDGCTKNTRIKSSQKIQLYIYKWCVWTVGRKWCGKNNINERLICGVFGSQRGSIYCDDIEIDSMGAEYRRLLGYLPQDFGYYGDFTAEPSHAIYGGIESTTGRLCR